MIRRILALLTSVILTLNIASVVFAQNNNIGIILNESFNNTISYATPKTVNVFGEGSLVQAIPEKPKKILRVKNLWESAFVDFPLQLGDKKEIVIETRVKFEDNYSEKEVLQYGNIANRFTLVKRSKGGKLQDTNGRNLCEAPNGKWIKISALINLNTLRYELYADDKLVLHRGKMINPDNITRIGFTSSESSIESTMYCDYIRAYTGRELVDDSFFPAAEFDERENLIKLENAIEPRYKPYLIFEMDCQSQDIGQGVNNVPIYAGSAGVAQDADNPQNKVYRINYTKGQAATIAMFSQVESYPCMVVQMDARLNTKSKMPWLIICRDSKAGGNEIRPFKISEDGKVLAQDETTILSALDLREEWVNIAAIINFKEKNIDYYINGELVYENFSYEEDKTNTGAPNCATTIQEVRIQCAKSGVIGDHYLDIDNVLLYKSPVIVDKSVLLGEGAVMSEDSYIDYTINTTPINPDMKMFTAVSESISTQKNPSSYLTDYSNTKNVYKDTICVVAESSNLWIKNGKYNSPYKFIWGGSQIIGPAETLAAFANQSYSYDEKTFTATIGKLTATVGDKFVTVEGTKYNTLDAVAIVDGRVYIPVAQFVRYGMNKFYGESAKGFGVIATEKKPYNFETNPGGGSLLYTVADYSHMMAYLILDHYNAATIKDKFEKNVKDKPYPRVQNIKKEAPKIKAFLETDPKMKEFSDLALKDAAGHLNHTLSIPDNPGVQINGIPSIFAPQQLWYAYYITGNRAYIDKIKEYATYLVNLQNWNADAHMLSTSWICLYLAYTYDLLYDELTQAEKDAIVDACTEKAIKMHKIYMNGTNWNSWPVADYNWNVICNTGPMLASMIFLGEGYDDDLFLETLEKGQVSLGYFMHYFAPDGGGFESPGYTNYLLSYLTPLLEGVETYFGESLGLINYPGYDKVGTFLANTSGLQNTWAIHCDTDSTIPCTALSMWFTKRFKDYEGQALNLSLIYKNMPQYQINGFTFMMNYMPTASTEVKYPEYLDKTYRGMQMGVSRDAWGESQQSFMGVHGGYNNDAGMQIDLGNFIFEYNGQLFADDPGRENYSIVGSAYPLRPEGHNLWVVNPDESPGQNKIAYGVVKVQESKPKGVIYSIDLLPAYYGQVKEAQRGYMLSEDRKIFTVQDEIVPYDGVNDFYWFWHTSADIEIDEEQKRAILTLNGEKCVVYFDSNVNFMISKQDKLEPLPKSPKIEGQLNEAQAKKMKKIVVNFYSTGEPVTFRAVAVPYGQKWSRSEIKPFKEWTIPDGSTTEGYDNADEILINGKLVENFKPNVYSYSMYYPSYYGAPKVDVKTKGKVDEIILPTEDTETLVVRIESSTVPGNYRTYTINLQSDYCVGLPLNAAEIPIVGVTASADDGNKPEGSIDRDFTTRWSSSNDEWITFDLGEVKEFNTLAFWLYGDDNRRLQYDIYVSGDGMDYKPVKEGIISSGIIRGWEYTQFNKVKARYVKMNCHGSTILPYNSLTEVAVYYAVEE